MSSTINEDIPYGRVIFICSPCIKKNSNRESKGFKTLPRLFNHLKQCENLRCACPMKNCDCQVRLEKKLLLKMIKDAINGNLDSNTIDQLRKYGMIRG